MRRLTVLAGLAWMGVWAACSSDHGVYDYPSGPTSVGTGTATGGTGAGGAGTKGVGEPCEDTGECRPGLACENGACAPGHSQPEGSPCVISGECKDGLYCADGKCAPAGDGTRGEECASDADCASGFKCVLVGLSAQCVPEGTGDVGDKCTTSADCFGGLACQDGACVVPEPGSPPFGTPWKGADCPMESGPVQAYFRVPRGVDDGDFYRLPFPNDVRLKGGKPDLSGHPTPGPDLLGYDVVDRYLRAAEQRDGFGLYHVTFFRFSGELDFDTFDNQVQLVDLTAGTGLGLYYVYGIGRGAYICPNWLGVRRSTGSVYTEGSTYAVILKNGVKAKGGAPVTRSPDLDALLATAAPADPVLAAEYPKYASLRAYLTAKAIDPATVLDASVFTVGHPRAPIEKLQPIVDAAPPPAASGWVRCDSGVVSPCPDATGERGCAAADPDFDELHALVKLPIYQEGTAPYLTPDDGGAFSLDGTGAPVVVRTEDVCMSLSVPKGAPPAGGWPTVVFAHATGGHLRSHVLAGVAKDFANGVDDGTGAVVKAAALGIDQVEHGPRRGNSTASPSDLFFNFANPKAALGNAQQGAADQMSLLRFVPSVSLDAATSPTGSAFSLSAAVAYWGHAQGATQGGIALPYGTYGGAALSGEGASLIDRLLTQTSPTNIAAVLPFVLADASVDGKLRGGAYNPVLSIIQTHMDGADPVAYARMIAKAPPTGVAAHHVFQPYGQKDTYSPVETQTTFALAAALGLVAHDPSVTTPDDIGGLTEIPTPAAGNATVNGKTVTMVLRQYAPASGKDGHYVAFDVPTARSDVERFLAGVLTGGVPEVGP